MVHSSEIRLVGERSLNGSSIGENGYSLLYGTGFSSMTFNTEGKGSNLGQRPHPKTPSMPHHVPSLRALRFFRQMRNPATDSISAMAHAMAIAIITPVLAPPR